MAGGSWLESVRGGRSALIVASTAYQDPGLSELRAPSADADALAAVLSDPQIGGFDVQTLLNEPAHVVNEAVEARYRPATGQPGRPEGSLHPWRWLEHRRDHVGAAPHKIPRRQRCPGLARHDPPRLERRASLLE
ncbi:MULTISPECIES: hypothetical protein [unclassified Kribbella]|uniref:hypothetical protein n=1 Tax=unclassified Kribbella TaxID=2644121 RepID=UPI0030179745